MSRYLKKRTRSKKSLDTVPLTTLLHGVTLISATQTGYRIPNLHGWASASRSMPPGSAFRHPVSQSGTGAFRYQTGSPYSATGLVPASAFLFIPVPDFRLTGCRKVRQSGI